MSIYFVYISQKNCHNFNPPKSMPFDRKHFTFTRINKNIQGGLLWQK